jgi:hypothetical protein
MEGGGGGALSLPYSGEYAHGRMSSAKAEYRFPSGTVYRGAFKNGAFHGKGVLVFKERGQYEGVWKDGALVSGKYTFEDGLAHEETKEWYCTERDRRFYGEHRKGVRPAGESVVRVENREGRPIPNGTYDVNDGYFNASTGHVHCYHSGKAVRTPSAGEKEVIMDRAFLQR